MEDNEEDRQDQAVPFPLTNLAVGAAAQHELFKTYVEAGFTQHQAMQILLLVIWHGMVSSN